MSTGAPASAGLPPIDGRCGVGRRAHVERRERRICVARVGIARVTAVIAVAGVRAACVAGRVSHIAAVTPVVAAARWRDGRGGARVDHGAAVEDHPVGPARIAAARGEQP
ncbi:MAG: hypothetical protein IPF99_09220 [Deltaproteobacteria bacterium]|nr:hypothetical protein [Deltaproteobacteria bacterium]